MVKRIYDLTLRQSQALTCIAYRKEIFQIVKVSNLITDMGVAFATLADHLAALKKRGYIETEAKFTRNLEFSDPIFLTKTGKAISDRLMEKIGATYGNDTTQVIFERLKEKYDPERKPSTGYETDLFFNIVNTKTSSFAKAFKKLVIDNPAEPVLTCIDMYTDLDTQLSLMCVNDTQKYKLLSRALLNLEIRNGRLASIAIPAAVRGTARIDELNEVLAGSWSWLGTVASRSYRRYWQEATYLGLLQFNGSSVTSLSPSPVDTLRLLAEKTNFTFINTIPVAPKSSLVIYRESFEFPTEEDLFHPEQSKLQLKWLNVIREGMNDREAYKATISEGLRILKDDAHLLRDYKGWVIPTSLYRRINSVADLSQMFNSVMDHQDSNLANILIAINQKPAITIYELWNDINKSPNNRNKMKLEDVWNMVSLLIPENLVQATGNTSVSKESTSLFSFLHIPVLEQKNISRKATNAVLRNLKPYLLHVIKELFSNIEERKVVYTIYSDLMKHSEMEFEQIEKDYGKPMARKIAVTSRLLEPFVTINSEYTRLCLNKDTIGLNQIILDSLLYSLLTATHDDSVNIYNNAIAALVEKDKGWSKDIDRATNSLSNLTTALLDRQKIFQ
jgi:DNA-binding MarR family transcriptional regulator